MLLSQQEVIFGQLRPSTSRKILICFVNPFLDQPTNSCPLRQQIILKRRHTIFHHIRLAAAVTVLFVSFKKTDTPPNAPDPLAPLNLPAVPFNYAAQPFPIYLSTGSNKSKLVHYLCKDWVTPLFRLRGHNRTLWLCVREQMYRE